MVELLVMGLRYALLIILYLFIFRIVLFIVRDLRQASAYRKPSGYGEAPKPAMPSSGDSVGQLVVLESDTPSVPKGETIKITKAITIGREKTNQVQVVDSYTSHEHARLVNRNGQYWIEDLGSTNGTFVNGHRISKNTSLLHGDRIKIGGVTFQFVRWEHETH